MAYNELQASEIQVTQTLQVGDSPDGVTGVSASYSYISGSKIETDQLILSGEALNVSLKTNTEATFFTQSILASAIQVMTDTDNVFFDSFAEQKKLWIGRASSRSGSIAGSNPGNPDSPFVSSPDGGVVAIKGNNAWIVNGITGVKNQITLGIIDTDENYDVEYEMDTENTIGLGATEKYSIISGNSDSRGANGLPIVQNLKLTSAGAYPFRLAIHGGGVDPIGRKLNDISYRLMAYQSETSASYIEFFQKASKGELVSDHDTRTLAYADDNAGAYSDAGLYASASADGLTLITGSVSASFLNVGDSILVSGITGSINGHHMVMELPTTESLVISANDWGTEFSSVSWVKKTNPIFVGGGKFVDVTEATQSVGLNNNGNYFIYSTGSNSLIGIDNVTQTLYPIGFSFEAVNDTGGSISLSGSVGVTIKDINGVGSFTSMRAVQVKPNYWHVFGGS